jgi:class 3 adenylate cyclase/predicted ATPase
MTITIDHSDRSDQERRYITILFSDLVGFTALSEQLDPEELREVQREYQRIAVDVMERYGGFVASFSGDGVLAYFGYPIAHESDAERAVRAGLELLERLQDPHLEVHERRIPPPAARIGVHTGLVVIGIEHASGGRQMLSAVGEAVNLASRLQAEAPHNSVVVTGDTLGLLAGLFETEPLGGKRLKGISRSVPVHKINRARRAHARGQHKSPVTQLVGRGSDLDRICAHWTDLQEDFRWKTIFIEGEAGVGKTRLVLEFCNREKIDKAYVLQMNCHEIFAGTPLYPLATLLWAQIGVTSEGDRAIERRNLSEFLNEIGLRGSENIEIAESILGLTPQDKLSKIAPTSLFLRQKQFGLLISVVRQLARKQPTVLWIDDSHWLDPSTAELLSEMADSLAGVPILLLMTRRTFPSGPASPVADDLIRLEPLTAEECFSIARSIPRSQLLSEDMLVRAVNAADGIPLFVEQMVLSLVDQSAGTAHDQRKAYNLPLSLAELFSERLDRLPGTRRIVLAAACLGRSFTPGFLALLFETSTAEIIKPLEALVAAEILRAITDGAEVRYELRHLLLQRIAYESMVRVERREMHGRIAGALARNPGATLVPSELIAHHLTEASQFHDAIRMWLDAGVSAARRSAHIEAIEHLERGLNLIEQIPEVSARRDLELKIQAALIGSITATQGSTSSNLSKCCQRGIQLCNEGDSTSSIFPFLFGQFTFTICRGSATEAAKLADLFLLQADQHSYGAGQVIGHRLLGMALLGTGRAVRAKQELKRSLELYSRERDWTTTYLFGQDAEVHGQALLALTQFCLGEVDEALRAGHRALHIADELRHPHSTAIALAYVSGWVAGLCGATDQLLEGARRLIVIAEQNHLGAFRSFGTAFLGWGLCQKGQLHQGIAELQQAVQAFDSVEYRLSMAGHLAHLADALRRCGRLVEAEAVCKRAMQIVSDGGDRWLEPDVLRIEALIANDREPEKRTLTQARLRNAIECARRFGNPIFELNCLLNLRDLQRSQQNDSEVETRISELSMFEDLTAVWRAHEMP